MPIKVAFIGAGSLGFTRTLMRDVLTVPELQDTHFAFMDIDPKWLGRVEQLCQRDIRENKLPARITATTDRRRAVADADYVVSCVRVGGLDAYQLDIDIPLKYGVDQCVGDTLCVGGILYGQRNVPQILGFCRDIREVARPGALFLNYANPMVINTWAALEYGGVNAVGLCHGVEGGWWQIYNALSALHGDKSPAGGDWRKECEVICAGINHQTWYVRILYKGRLIGSEELLKAFEKHPAFSQTEKVRIDVLRRFGYYSTESNGHLSEYLPWYRKRPRDIRKWIDMSSWINGETGGYLRVVREGRNLFDREFRKWLKNPVAPLLPEHRSHEHGSYIIEALETGRCYRGHFNVRNHGTIPNLPPDCVIEVPGYVDHNGMAIPRVDPLPDACAATLNASVSVQRMAVRAAVAGDVTLLKQAVLHDPLTGAVCDPDEIWQMVDEMLVAQARWLPQYVANGSVAAARRRLAAVKRAGLYRGTNRWQGAARVKERTAAEIARQGAKARAQAMATDKAAAQRAQDAKRGAAKKRARAR